jgi:cation transport regulator ChaB
VDSASTTEGTLEEGRSEWGNLPPRIREILSQSRRDRVSALYQQATEAYYRRLAEERQP